MVSHPQSDINKAGKRRGDATPGSNWQDRAQDSGLQLLVQASAFIPPSYTDPQREDQQPGPQAETQGPSVSSKTIKAN
jgi:hypothetical protein